MKKRCDIDCSRLNKVGGQAVLEGVMMKAGERTVTTCRKEDGSLVVTDDVFVSVRKKKKILNLPIIRGFVNFIEMMKLSVKTLEVSADALDLEDDKEKEKKQKAKDSGRKAVGTVDIVMVLGVVLGLALAIGLFFLLPSLIAEGIEWFFTEVFNAMPFDIVAVAVIEGLAKIAIFITYIALVALMPDIKRTFMYHGAEHKSIACFEAGEELTPDNARKHTRFHPRCGTSFMFLMILIGVFVGIFVRFVLPSKALFSSDFVYSMTVSGIKILLLPITMGVGYEVLMLAGKHDNFLTRAISAPGLWVQRLTTKEPTLDMLEVAITSIKCALRDDYPEYMEFFESKAWLPDEPVTDGGEADAESAEGEGLDLPVMPIEIKAEGEGSAPTAEAGVALELPILDVASEPANDTSEKADDTADADDGENDA